MGLSSLTSNDYQKFRAALLAAFPSLPELRRMVMVDLGEDLSYITSNENIADAVIALIRWAESQNRLGELLEATRKAVPESPELSELAVPIGVASLNLNRDQRNRLLRALHALPDIESYDGRGRLLARFPPVFVASVGRFEKNVGLDLTGIVRAAETWGPVQGTSAILTLIDTAREMASRSKVAQDLEALHQELVAPAGASPAAMLTPELRQRLLDVLGSIPLFDTPDGRQLLLNDLPPSLVAQLARHSAKEIDLANMVRGMEAWGTLPDGRLALQLLVQNALVFCHGSKSQAAGYQRELEAIDAELASGDRRSVEAFGTEIEPPPSQLADGSKGFSRGAGSYESSFVERSPADHTPDLRRQLHEALLGTFPSQADLEQMVFFSLGENLYSIASEGTFSSIVLKLIMWAEAKGRTKELIAGALSSNAGNRKLRQVAAMVGLIPK
jgi:Effector-associated domain 1